jgi:hypothetical protein
MHKLLLPLILLLTATGGIAALTGAGEAADWLWGLATLPVSHPDGEAVASGTLNVGQGLELTALRAAVDSTYAAIVRLVRQLFALEAILRLHFDQENELYAGLAGEG